MCSTSLLLFFRPFWADVSLDPGPDLNLGPGVKLHGTFRPDLCQSVFAIWVKMNTQSSAIKSIEVDHFQPLKEWDLHRNTQKRVGKSWTG